MGLAVFSNVTDAAKYVQERNAQMSIVVRVGKHVRVLTGSGLTGNRPMPVKELLAWAQRSREMEFPLRKALSHGTDYRRKEK